MKTRVITSRTGFDHRPPEGHPEHAGRLEAALSGAADAGLEVVDATAPASREALLRAHTQAHVERVFAAAPASGEAALDADTWMSPGSLDAALFACGAAIEGVDAVLDGEAEAVFVACRPPGHHAERDRAMGFCLFNQIAVAAAHALEMRGLGRVALVDIDVHHGNGTQDFAEAEARAFFASIHQRWIYPGTGAAHETGRFGNIANAPMERGATGAVWRPALEALLEPVADHRPELLLVSAGFDAHEADPLAGLALTEADYAWAGERLGRLAREHAKGRLVCVLEGGYDCDALRASVAGFARGLETA